MKITSSNYFIKQNYSNIASPLKSGKINDFNYGKYYSVFSDKKISPIYFKANFPVFKKENIDFQYSPISSKSPNFNLVGSYDDLDKFSELFADKLNSKYTDSLLFLYFYRQRDNYGGKNDIGKTGT